MDNLGTILAYLYPEASREDMFEVAQGGSGAPHVTRWDVSLGPQPTDQGLLDALIPMLKNSKRREMRRSAFAEQDTLLAPGYEDRDYIHIILAALTRTPDPRQAALMTIKQKLDTRLAAVDAATTEADVAAISW